MKILIVDESSDDRQILRHNIERHGHEALEAQDGQDGLEKAASHKPDLIISDVMMPRVDGFQFLKNLKADETLRSIPFVFYTAAPTESHETASGLSIGAQAYIKKPKEPKDLWTELNAIIERTTVGPGSADVKEFKRDEEFHKGYYSTIEASLKEKVRELETEIATRKEMETSLKLSEERYYAVAESASDAIICINADGLIYLWNKKAEDMFGYAAKEAIGKKVHSLIVPDKYREKTNKGFALFAKTGQGPAVGKIIELTALKKDGAEFPIELSISAIKVHDVWHSTGIVRDITERKRTEEERKKNEERYRGLVETTEDLVWEIDTNCRYTYVNPRIKEILGYAPAEALGKTGFDFMPPNEASRMSAAFSRIAASKAAFSRLESARLHKSGRLVMLESSGAPILDAAGNLLGYRGVTRDVTERKIAEGKLKQEVEVTSNLLMIAEATAQTTDTSLLHEKVAEYSRRALASDACLIYLYYPHTETFNPVRASGLKKKHLPTFVSTHLDYGNILVKKTIDSKAPIIIDLSAKEIAEAGNGAPGRIPDYLKDASSAAAIPLIGKENILGIIVVLYEKPKTFNDMDMRLMRGISQQVSMAIEQAHLYRESTEKAMDLSHEIEMIRVMNDIDKAILSTLEPDMISDTVVNTISRLIQCDRVAVLSVDMDRGGFIVSSETGLPSMPKGRFLSFAETSAANVVKTGRHAYSPRLTDDKDPPLLEKELIRYGIVSCIRSPLTVKGTVTGVLVVGSTRHAAYSSQDLTTLEKLAAQICVALENSRLIEDLESLFIGTVKSLSAAIDAKSKWTAGHSERVSAYAMQIGSELGLSRKEFKELELASLLHDIGKIGTYEGILEKPSKLTDEEMAKVKEHPAKGAEILAHIKQLRPIIPAIKYHHEYHDGNGYPEGIKGDVIPLYARIISVADTADAMGADRPYRRGKPLGEILQEIRRCSGTQFAPPIVEAFLKTQKS